jgi:hypothetical protein
MAEIQVERTKKSSAKGWVILIVLVALLGAGWYFMMGPGAAMTADMMGPPPAPAPTTP